MTSSTIEMLINPSTTVTLDSYATANQDSDEVLEEDHPSTLPGHSACGQSFTTPNDGKNYRLTSAKFYLKKSDPLLPDGTLVAKLYAHSGVYGTSSIPSGNALAASDSVDLDTLTNAYALYTFTFSSIYVLEPNTQYCIDVEADATWIIDTVMAGYDGSAPSHGGNMFHYDTSAFHAVAGSDLIFYVYGIEAIHLTKQNIQRNSMSIGTWDITADNYANRYGGLISPQDPVELKINGVSMLKGYVDDVLPNVKTPTMVYYNLMRVVGRDYAQDLANKYITKDYPNAVTVDGNIDQIVYAALVEASSEITYAAPTPLREKVVSYSFKRTFLANGFQDLMKLGDCDFYVEDDKALHLFNYDTFSSDLTVNANSGQKNVAVSDDTGFYPGQAVLVRDDVRTNPLNVIDSINHGTLTLTMQDNLVNSILVADNGYAKGYDYEMSGVTLKGISGDPTNNILSLEIGESLGFDIRTYIEVHSTDVDDHWTGENHADYYTDNCTVTSDSTVGHVVAGISSIKATATANGVMVFGLHFSDDTPLYTYAELNVYNEGNVNATFMFRHNHALSIGLTIALEDVDGNVITLAPTSSTVDANLWRKVTVPMGPDNLIDGAVDHWSFNVGIHFHWEDIKKFEIWTAVIVAGEYYLFDALSIPSIEAKAIADQLTPWGGHGKRMLSISRPDVKSQVQLQSIADDELAKMKNPLQKIKIVCVGNTSLKYPSQTVEVIAPDSGIGTAPATTVTYRILSLHMECEPHVDLLKGNDFIQTLELIRLQIGGVYQPVDPSRGLRSGNPSEVRFRNMSSRLRIMET